MSSSMGGCFNLRCIGQTPLSKFTTGFNVLQKPLHDIYVSYLTPKGMRQPAASRLALTDRGIILTVEGKDSFYSMRDILLWEAVHWVRVQTKDKKFMSAFEPIDPDRHRGKDSLFSKLDSQYKYLTKLNHEPVLACVLRRTSGPKTIDVHAYVCSSEAQALDIVAAITRMQQLFQAQEQRPIQEQQQPASVRVPSGSSAAAHQGNAANGFRSQRQPKPSERGDGEITLEELMRLADMAITDPAAAVKGSGAAAGKEAPPPFRMGESWTANENQHGVRRAKTFNEGQKRKTAGEPRNIADQDRRPSNARLDVQRPSEAPRGGGGGGGGGGGVGGAVAWKELQDARYYENDSVVPNGQQRTYENLGPPGSIPPTDNYGVRRSPVPQPRPHQQQPQQRPPTDDRDAARMNGEQLQMADQPRRKSVPPESLRMVIAESKAANRRVSVLPRANAGYISTSAFNLSVAGEPRAPAIVDVYVDSDHHHHQPFQPNPSPKPVAMVQPRKVSGVKVLPEPGLEVVQLQKVSQQQPAAGKAGDEAKKEQYQRGDGGGGGNRNFTRSMFELNKPTTPQARKKFTSAEPDPVRKFTSAEPEPVRKFTSAEPDSVRKFTSAEPDPVRKFTSAEPDPVRKFTSAEPDPVRKFTSAEPDPVRKFTSAEPDPVRKFTSAEPDPVRKFTSAEPDPVRKFTSADPEPARKSSNPEAVKRDGKDSKAAAGEKPSGGERGKKDAEIEAFAMNVNFYKPPTNTLSPHGTNFESALGYFP